MEKLKDTVIIYHAHCRDGFGAAYAAWKKFGDTASYLPMKNQSDLPVEIKDKEIFVVDYSFNQENYDKLRAENKSIIIIDHHQSAEAVVTAYPENIFDLEHSGAVLTWKYFHPDTPVPTLLEYVEDHDIWKFALPNNREFCSALGEYAMTFVSWDTLIEKIKDPSFLASFLKTGSNISKFEDRLVNELLEHKERVLFEGHAVWALNVSRRYRSILGHKLAKLNKETGDTPIGIVYYHNEGSVSVSLRSEDDVDVASIATKYGGGGHKHAASIKVAGFADLPFTFM